MTDTTQDQGVPEIEINDKKDVIDLDAHKEEPPIDESDPRAAIYKKVKDKRNQDVEGVPVGTEAGVEPAPEVKPKDVEEDITVKVNGKERKVSRVKVEEAGGIAAYQKQAAASELLNQASAKQRELHEEALRLQARSDRLQQMEKEFEQRTKSVAPPVEAGALKELASKYHEVLIEGDTEAASELLLKIQGARQVATPDTEEIAKRAALRAREEIHREREIERANELERDRIAGLSKFEDEYSDIASDPELREMANRKTVDIMAEHPEWAPSRIIDESAKTVRDWVSKRFTPSAASDKLDAKRSQTTVKGGTARAIPRPTAKPQTPSGYIEGLRKARGLE